MKIKEQALANATGALGLIYYLVCYAVAVITPELYKSIAQAWFHMIDLGPAWRSGPDGFVLGLVSFGAVSWITGWLFAKLYNVFAGSR